MSMTHAVEKLLSPEPVQEAKVKEWRKFSKKQNGSEMKEMNVKRSRLSVQRSKMLC